MGMFVFDRYALLNSEDCIWMGRQYKWQFSSLDIRAVFNWLSEVIIVWFGNWWLVMLAPFSRPKTKDNVSHSLIFPPLVPATCNCFEFWLTQLCCLGLPWLARVITLGWFYDSWLNPFMGCLVILGKTFTLLSDDGITTRVVQHCFEKINNDESHTYKVSLYGTSLIES